MFPGFLPRLMKHTHVGGTNNLDKSVLFGKEVLLSESDSLGRLLDVYVSQCHYYWQEPDVLAWLEHNVEAVLRLVEPVIIPGSSTSACPNADPDPRLRKYSEKLVYVHCCFFALCTSVSYCLKKPAFLAYF
ncbi:unnamed protein product [Dibothriocephalus latus]|uniref:Uncharacterized protein n=1 Tax=Dibothriocephalus latus TaxID=60516 RepID=A0A3P6QEW5_DIBLA|nr:unnamed protein product [Dibothriocephalus latus]